MKMNKKISKLISIVMILICMVSMLGTLSLAAGLNTNPIQFSGTAVSGTSKIGTLGNQIIGVLTIVGSIIAVIILVVLGIKYMMGSPEEKSQYKSTFIPYIVGALLIFAAAPIAGMIYNIATQI